MSPQYYPFDKKSSLTLEALRTSANKPDFCARLKVEHHEYIELVFGKFSQLDAPPQKHCDDWNKLVRSGKDSIDMLRDVCFHQEIEDIIRKALRLKTCMENIMRKVEKALTESTSLPVNESNDALERACLYSINDRFPQKRQSHN
ncbi:7667_t:CDS:2 [Paraglomus occultum]|uniref:7667_t:CDS:1 n=1 Tax=Paraglomus occultum TaxID=144539 RepID=A0A9N9A574_9GLOM|nr:7667_t:CDS:2 [Paraglomus occultum]